MPPTVAKRQKDWKQPMVCLILIYHQLQDAHLTLSLKVFAVYFVCHCPRFQCPFPHHHPIHVSEAHQELVLIL